LGIEERDSLYTFKWFRLFRSTAPIGLLFNNTSKRKLNCYKPKPWLQRVREYLA